MYDRYTYVVLFILHIKCVQILIGNRRMFCRHERNAIKINALLAAYGMRIDTSRKDCSYEKQMTVQGQVFHSITSKIASNSFIILQNYGFFS